MENLDNVMVSVIVTTYNQEKYIAKTLDSIIMQKVNFPIEIIVGDDCSTDCTTSIVQEYANKYPRLIRAVLRKENLGPTRNSYELCISSKGKYITGCEGDDYYATPYKLQMQYDFLENHPEYYACCTKFKYIDENGNILADSAVPVWDKRLWYNSKEIFTIDDFNAGRLPSQGSTIFCHNFYIKEDVSIIHKAHFFMGDVTSVMLLLNHGNIYCMDEITLYYRRNTHNDDKSWASMIRRNGPQVHYDILQFYDRLEKYAANNLSIKVDRVLSKEIEFIEMVKTCLRLWNRARWVYLFKSLRIMKNKLHFIKVIMFAMYLYSVNDSLLFTKIKSKQCKSYSRFDKCWRDFFSDLQEKKLVLFGAGGGCIDVIESYLDKLPIDLIVDKNEKKQKTYVGGFSVKSVESLFNYDKDNTVILITSGMYYEEIAEQLESMGFFKYYVYQLMELKKWRYIPLKFIQKSISNIN